MMNNTNLGEADLVATDKLIRQRLGVTNDAQGDTKRISIGSTVDNLKYQSLGAAEGDGALHSSISMRSLHPGQGETKSLRSSKSVRSNLSVKSALSKALDGQSFAPAGELPQGTVTQEAWAEIVKYNAQQYQQEQEEARRKREEQKQRVKEELARQMDEKRALKR